MAAFECNLLEQNIDVFVNEGETSRNPPKPRKPDFKYNLLEKDSQKQNIDVFVIAGEPSRTSEVSIQFKSGLHPAANTILSITLGLDNMQLIVNSLKNGDKQGNPKTKEIGYQKKDFKFYILVFDGKCEIALDDIHKCSYEPQLSTNSIQAIFIYGAKISRVDHRSVYPAPFPLVLEEDQNFSFSADIPRQLRNGDKISIIILPKEDFTVSLGDFIDIRGKIGENGKGMIEAALQSQTQLMAAEWTKNVQLKVNFLIEKDFILVSCDKGNKVTENKIDEKNLQKIFKITAKSRENDSLKVNEIIFN